MKLKCHGFGLSTNLMFRFFFFYFLFLIRNFTLVSHRSGLNEATSFGTCKTVLSALCRNNTFGTMPEKYFRHDFELSFSYRPVSHDLKI